MANKPLSQVTAELSAKLNPKAILQRTEGWGNKQTVVRYTTSRAVFNRFNKVFEGMDNGYWSVDFETAHNPTNDHKVYVKCSLSITVDQMTITRAGAGEANGQYPNPDFDPSKPPSKDNKRNIAGKFGGAFKSAESDAIKRAAFKFGFGLELYDEINAEDDEEDMHHNQHPAQEQMAAAQNAPALPEKRTDPVDHGILEKGPARKSLAHNDLFQHRARFYGFSGTDLNFYVHPDAYPIFSFPNYASDTEKQYEVEQAFNGKWKPEPQKVGVRPEILEGSMLTFQFECSDPGVVTRGAKNPVVYLVGVTVVQPVAP